MVELLDNNLAWYEKYRPQTIDEVVFEDEETEARIREFVENGRIIGNIISYGDGGTGKSTINYVLYMSIIKNIADIFKLGKSVKDMEKLRSWLLNDPQGSAQKIVVCEEFDRLSKEAQTELKDGLMEKYQSTVSYLVTTNNIHSIDPALLQRFNIKLNFTVFNVDGVFFRMEHILQKENVNYDRNEVYTLVNQYKTKGIRNLINALQTGSIKGEFKLQYLKGFSTTSGIEDTIFEWTNYMFNYLKASGDLKMIYETCLLPTSNKDIGVYYSKLIETLKEEPGINYEYIFKRFLEDENTILPLKKIMEKYYQQLRLVSLPHIHFQSAIFESFNIIYRMSGGEKVLISI